MKWIIMKWTMSPDLLLWKNCEASQLLDTRREGLQVAPKLYAYVELKTQ